MNTLGLYLETTLVIPPDVDVRGFVHSLAAARTKLVWQLDQRRADLGRVLADIHRLQVHISTLARQAQQYATELITTTAHRLDPHAHRQVLTFLTHLRLQQAKMQQELQQQADHREILQQECIALQLRIEAMDNHHQDELNQFVDTVRRREANERDQEWLARRHPTPSTSMSLIKGGRI